MKKDHSEKNLHLGDLEEVKVSDKAANGNGSHEDKLVTLDQPDFHRLITEEKEAGTPQGQKANLNFEKMLRQMLAELGENPDREGLLDTPRRVRRSLAFLTDGYGKDVHEVLGSAVFEENYDEMVLVRDIEMYSMCEHHMLPFYGKCHIA